MSKYRWLPAIKDAVDNSVPKPKTPDEPKFEDILGTRSTWRSSRRSTQERLRADRAEDLKAAANEMTAFIKQQGGYF